MFHRRRNGHDTEENGVHNVNVEKDVSHQLEKLKELKASVGPFTSSSDLQYYCTDACLRRYLEARNWNVEKAKKMLEDSLKWRSTYKPQEIRWHQVQKEGETGKIYRANFTDKEGRIVLILRPGKENTTSHDGQIRYLVYQLETAISNLPEGKEQMVWFTDYTGWSMSKAPPLKTARETINILQNHYPERLAFSILYNPPRIFEVFWKAVKYFIDPRTYQKVKFIYPKNKESMELIEKNFDCEVLPVELGGKCNWEFDYDEYSRLMAEDDKRLDILMASLNNKNVDEQANGYTA